MKTVTPGYYSAFRCIGGKCRHSCCIGWEIDVDPDTLTHYRQVPGEFGKRLRNGLSEEDGTACFALDEQERCPFLNREGLCDIILTLGEDSLCQICRDHPRFRNVFSDRVEMGLGLCCEEACRLILTDKTPMTLVSSGESTAKPTEDEVYFHSWREQVFALMQNRRKSIDERAEDLLDFCQMKLPEKTAAQWAQVYSELTVMDENWLDCLDALAEKTGTDHWYSPAWDTAWEQLILYFLYRYLPDGIEDGSLPERAAFALLSFRIIRSVCAVREADDPWEILTDTARLYSAEVEYAEENVAALLDLLCEENNV